MTRNAIPVGFSCATDQTRPPPVVSFNHCAPARFVGIVQTLGDPAPLGPPSGLKSHSRRCPPAVITLCFWVPSALPLQGAKFGSSFQNQVRGNRCERSCHLAKSNEGMPMTQWEAGP
jgi:hypothetical protein